MQFRTVECGINVSTCALKITDMKKSIVIVHLKSVLVLVNLRPLFDNFSVVPMVGTTV